MTPLFYIAPTLLEAARIVNTERWHRLRSLRINHRRITPMADAILMVHCLPRKRLR